MGVSMYSSFEKAILQAASYSIVSRLFILPQLHKFATKSAAGVEGWFQWEFVLSPWSRQWTISKDQSPADLIIQDNQGQAISVEVKGITSDDFDRYVPEWFFPKKRTKKQSIAQIEADRKDSIILFLSTASAYNKRTKNPPRFVPPLVKQISNDWVIGIIKRI